MRRLTSLLYGREFVNARLVTYAVAYGLLELSLVLPLHYSCSTGVHCLGCGFRSAVERTLDLDLTAACAQSPLIIPAIVITAVVLADVFAIAWRRHSGSSK